MSSLHIYVSPEHIKLGLPLSCKHCPVFWAVSDALKGTGLVCTGVDGDNVTLSTEARGAFGHTVLDVEVSVWTHRFDYGNPVDPFEFDLEIPATLEAYFVQT